MEGVATAGGRQAFSREHEQRFEQCFYGGLQRQGALVSEIVPRALCEAYEGLQKYQKTRVMAYVWENMKDAQFESGAKAVSKNRIEKFYNHMYKRHLYDGNLDDRKPAIQHMAQRFFKGARSITPAQYREFFENVCRECGTDNGGRQILYDRIDSHARYVIGKMGIALDKGKKAERVCGRKV